MLVYSHVHSQIVLRKEGSRLINSLFFYTEIPHHLFLHSTTINVSLITLNIITHPQGGSCASDIYFVLVGVALTHIYLM